VAVGVLNALATNKVQADVFEIPSARPGTPVISAALGTQIVSYIQSMPVAPDAIFLASQSCYDLPAFFQQVDYTPKAMIQIQCFTAATQNARQLHWPTSRCPCSGRAPQGTQLRRDGHVPGTALPQSTESVVVPAEVTNPDGPQTSNVNHASVLSAMFDSEAGNSSAQTPRRSSPISIIRP